MGAIFSSNKDFNQTLARQPRAPIRLLRFDVPDNLQQYPLTKTLSIPVPVRHTQSNIRAPVTLKKSSRPDSNQTLIKPNIISSINQQTVENQPSPEKALLVRSASYTPQPTYQENQSTMNGDARIVYRSVTNLNHHRRMDNRQLSSFEPQRSIVERNGKQFVTEIKQRMERRHVQIFDETTGRMRLFEVLDYIPSRVVRSAKSNTQIPVQNTDSRSSHSSSSNSYSDRSEKGNHPSVTDRLQTHAEEFDLYQRGVLQPMNNNNNNMSKQSSGQGFSNDRYPSKEYDKAAVSSREGSRYVPAPIRHHSPSGSEYSVSSSTTSDDGSESESSDAAYSSNNRTDSSGFYGTRGGRSPALEIDPFKKPVHPSSSFYKRPHYDHNYTEPLAKNSGLIHNSGFDYSFLIH